MTKKLYEHPKVPALSLFAWIHKLTEFCYWKKKYSEYRTKFDIHPEFNLNGRGIMINGNGKLTIKGNGQFCYNTYIELDKGAVVELGNDVTCSKNLTIYTKPYDDEKFIRTGKPVDVNGEVIIGNRVFIYPFVFIQGSVTIGDNVIIKSFSTVDRDIPSNSVFRNGIIKPLGGKNE